MLNDSPVMTVEETAQCLKTSTDTVYVLVKSKDFPAIKIGGKWKIVKAELNVWLRNQCLNKAE